MTVDDETSIYVGGLPYNATEDTLRRVFSLYGSIVAVKIINDRGTRGKCYGFVTFRNPRSVIDAINDMNGKNIDGRIVKVNGVTNRSGRPNFSRDRFQKNSDRGLHWDRSRDRERDYDHDRDRYWERHSDRSRERDRSLDHDEDRERGFEHSRDHNRAKDDFMDRDQIQDRYLVTNEKDHVRNSDLNREKENDLEWDGDREMDGSNGGHGSQVSDKDMDQSSRKQNGSTYDDRHNREISSDLSDDYDDEVKEQLERSIQRREELRKEISQLEEKLDMKQLSVSVLHKKAKKLEDALIAAKKVSSQREMQLIKLHKSFDQVKEYNLRLKSSEEELQALVDSAMVESDMNGDIGRRNRVIASGKA